MLTAEFDKPSNLQQSKPSHRNGLAVVFLPKVGVGLGPLVGLRLRQYCNQQRAPKPQTPRLKTARPNPPKIL